ncbi:MAG: cupin domain-containing protein [Gaiellaceae bacterium MAG52_C11]|nr:cupin domain-containing protein [Candidatus Gaiellasilicea maunaloa]
MTSLDTRTKIRILTARDLVWMPAETNTDEKEPAGQECTAFESLDGRFSIGLWHRDAQRRQFTRPYDEVALILEGDVTLHVDGGPPLHAGAGDVVVTPAGSSARWESGAPVRKLWAIYDTRNASSG